MLSKGKSRLGECSMKLMCKCGNIENLKTDNKPVNYEIKNCNDGTLALICKKCNEVVFIEFNNK
jgi:hypothetical protein